MIRFCFAAVFAFSVLSGAAQPPRSSLLWEISGNGLDTPSYIFGTFHMMCKEDFSFSDILKNKISNSRQFYGELDMDDPGLEMQLAMKLVMKDKTLSSLMPEEDFNKIGSRFQEITGMPLAMFNNFKPFMALSLLTLNSISCTQKVQPETEFTNFAKENRIPILGLETVDEQISVLDSEPVDSQVNTLKLLLLNFDSARNVMQQLVTVYKKRDIDSLHAYMRSVSDHSAFENELLTKRNHNWAPKIEKAMALKPSFFAVGAGHLGGEEGVVHLLRKRGYTVVPVAY